MDISAKKSSSEKNSTAARQSNLNCAENVPMTALACCPMPQFMKEAVIRGCRGPGFFDCLVDAAGMCTKDKDGKNVVDKQLALTYMLNQLNETTKNAWTKPVKDGVTTAVSSYTNGNKDAKDFLDALLRELYKVSLGKTLTGKVYSFLSLNRIAQPSKRTQFALHTLTKLKIALIGNLMFLKGLQEAKVDKEVKEDLEVKEVKDLKVAQDHKVMHQSNRGLVKVVQNVQIELKSRENKYLAN